MAAAPTPADSSAAQRAIRRALFRDTWRVIALALIIGGLIALAQTQPGYTDAAYYLDNALRLSHGQGLTDATIWTYIGLPPQLTWPIPAFLYWQPLTSLLEATGIALFGSWIGSFHAAQIGLVMCYAGMAAIGYRVGARLGASSGGSRSTGWVAALLTMFSGFFAPYWGSPDTFSLYGLIGALCLYAIGEGSVAPAGRSRPGWWGLGGVMAGLAALTRADGLLLIGVLVGAAVLTGIWPQRQSVNEGRQWGHILSAIGIGLLGYLIVTLPWDLHNLTTIGSLLPIGGLQTAWIRSYDQVVAYPPNASLSDFLNWGAANIVQSRVEALITNAETFIVVEGLVVLAPLMLIGAWVRRADRRLWGFALYAIGLHLIMTLLFALPGERGGLLHSSAALVPFWSALGTVGLSDLLGWVIKRRRRWRIAPARRIFTTGLVAWAIVLSLWIASRQIGGWNTADAVYRQIGAALPRDAIVMVNDPPMFYDQTGLAGVVVPNESPGVVEQIAFRFKVGYLILDHNRTAPLAPLYDPLLTPASGAPSSSAPNPISPLPPFLQLIGQFHDPVDSTAPPIVVYRILIPQPGNPMP